MTNLEAIRNEILLRQFDKFYNEIVNIRDKVEAMPEKNMKEAEDKALKVLDDYALNLEKFKDEVGIDIVKELFYMMTVFTDEIFISIDWGGNQAWEDNLLEEKFFKSHFAGNKVFENIDSLLNTKAEKSKRIALIYLLVLALGFKGKFLFNDPDNALLNYRKKLFSALFNLKSNVFEKLHSLFPQNNTEITAQAKKILSPDFIKWTIYGILGTLLFSYIIMSLINPYFASKSFLLFLAFINDYETEIIILFVLILILCLAYFLFRIIRRYKILTFFSGKYLKFQISETFRQAAKFLRHKFGTNQYQYQLPWYLILGTLNSGKTSLLKKSNIKELDEYPLVEKLFENSVCNIWMYDSAVIIDIDGKIEKIESEKNLRKYIFTVLNRYRRRRPLDGIIITAAYDDLISVKNNQAENLNLIKNKALNIREQIEMLQKKIKMQLPVYILVTKCDMIAGFREFVNEVPSRYLQNIFGWSNTYSSQDYTFSKNWLQEAFQSINEQLSFIQMGLFTYQSNLVNNHNIFLFGRKVDELKYPLQIFVNNIFLTTGTSKLYPLLFRGLYMCGTSINEYADIDARDKLFIRDLFEKKIFNEPYLAKPNKKFIF
jgi:type IV/VI secretion system ImpK/VasF family protein